MTMTWSSLSDPTGDFERLEPRPTSISPSLPTRSREQTTKPNLVHCRANENETEPGSLSGPNANERTRTSRTNEPEPGSRCLRTTTKRTRTWFRNEPEPGFTNPGFTNEPERTKAKLNLVQLSGRRSCRGSANGRTAANRTRFSRRVASRTAVASRRQRRGFSCRSRLWFTSQPRAQSSSRRVAAIELTATGRPTSRWICSGAGILFSNHRDPGSDKLTVSTQNRSPDPVIPHRHHHPGMCNHRTTGRPKSRRLTHFSPGPRELSPCEKRPR
jgi:hypothetical protein